MKNLRKTVQRRGSLVSVCLNSKTHLLPFPRRDSGEVDIENTSVQHRIAADAIRPVSITT